MKSLIPVFVTSALLTGIVAGVFLQLLLPLPLHLDVRTSSTVVLPRHAVIVLKSAADRVRETMCAEVAGEVRCLVLVGGVATPGDPI